VDAGGQPNQFIGDGLLALFGIDTDAPTACRQAIKAAAMVADNMQRLNQEFAKDLRAPIAFGIGIHGGDVVIGDIGYRARSVFTAIGDAVNVAARLEEMTKSLKCKVVISEEVCRTAGIACETLPLSQAAVRGRDQPLAIRAVADPSVLMGMVETEPTNNAAAAVRTTPAAAEA
jgi:adenylate cyclase